MGRPWLNIDVFNLKDSDLTLILDKQVENEVLGVSNLSLLANKKNNLKNYEYKNVHIYNYGKPVLDKNNNLIGYKLNNNEYATIKT